MMKNFIGFMSLQAGVAVLSSLYTSMAIVSVTVNLFSLSPEAPIAWAVVILMNVYTWGIWTLAMLGSYKVKVASTLWTIYIFMWIIAVIVSYFVKDGEERYVCVKQRCPESLWLFTNIWHNLPSADSFQSSYMLDTDSISGEISVEGNAMVNPNPVIMKDFQALESKRLKSTSADQGRVIGLGLALTLFTIYTFGLTVLSSFKEELECIDECVCENEIDTNV